jgi:hypothetical protein
MLRFLVLAMTVCAGVLPAAGLSEVQSIVSYECKTGECDLECWGPGGTLAFQYSNLTVFQFKDHPRRLWLGVNGAQYVLGDDFTCMFEGTPSIKLTTSPLGPPPTPPKVCIGSVCTP